MIDNYNKYYCVSQSRFTLIAVKYFKLYFETQVFTRMLWDMRTKPSGRSIIFESDTYKTFSQSLGPFKLKLCIKYLSLKIEPIKDFMKYF